jgi:hypothetical protein
MSLIAYVDTSALVKLFLIEDGSQVVSRGGKRRMAW